jgi:pimeloyl-ACP methyl ester carboxylesterase
MNTAAAVILIAVCVLAAVLTIVSVIMARIVAKPHYFTIEEARKIEKDLGVYGDYDSYEKHDYTIQCRDGYIIHAQDIPSAGNTGKYVIISHGYGYNRMGSVKYVNMFHTLGYSCILYDNRSHGENRRTYVTMGKMEHLDLCDIIKDTYSRFGKDIYLGLHGESMGSALSVMALGEHPDVKFLVSDCGYADLQRLFLSAVNKYYHLPSWTVYPSGTASRILYGFSYREIQPYRALEGNSVPVLFIHGGADGFVPAENCRIMYDSDTGYKEMVIVKGADHAKSFQTDPAAYTEYVRNFLNRIEKQKN